MTYSLTLRETKGSELTILEMDNNLLYLQALADAGMTGSQGPQGSRGFDGSNGAQGPQGNTGKNGDIYFATSSNLITVPNIGYVVNFKSQPNLSYTIGQTVIVSNTIESEYVDGDYDDDDYDIGYFHGIINWYDVTSGTMSVVTTLSGGVGNTFSYWYLNISGAVGPQGSMGVGTGSTVASGTQGSIQYNSNNLITGATNFYWDGSALNIYNGADTDVLRLGNDASLGYIYLKHDSGAGTIGFWNDGDGTLHLSGNNITKSTPDITDSSTTIATTQFVHNVSTATSNLFTFTLSSNSSLLSSKSIIKNSNDGTVDFNYTTQNYNTAYLSFKTNLTLNGQQIGLYSGGETLDYGFLFHSNGNVYITELGSADNGVTYNSNDLFVMEVKHNRVIYYRNSSLWHINETALTENNYVGYFSLNKVNDTINEISYGYLVPDILPLTASFNGTTLNTGNVPYSSTYSIILSASASLNDVTFIGEYSGTSGATFTVTITQLNSYIPLVEGTENPFQVGEIIQGQQTNVTASVVYIESISGGAGSALATDGQVDFSGNSHIIGLSSGANAAYDSLRAADLFTWYETGGAGGSGSGITNISYVTNTTILYDNISLTFDNAIGHSLGDQWIYQINQIYNDPIIINSNSGEVFRINSQGDVIINQVPYQFPDSQGSADSLLQNNGSGELTWTVPTPRTADFIAISLSNSGLSASSMSLLSLKYPYAAYSRGITLDSGLTGSNVLLNNANTIGKLYQIHLSFFVYNINESVSYRLKINGSSIGLEIDLYQNSNNDSLRMVSASEIVSMDSASTLEFWRTSDNSVDPPLQGTLNIIEII